MAREPRKPHIPDFSKVAARFMKVAIAVTDEQVRKFAEQERSGFVKKIRAQDFRSFKMRPLRPSTLAQKRRYHRSLKTMITTGTYIDSIQVHVNSTPTPTRKIDKQYVIGIDPRIRAVHVSGKVRRNVSLNDVARWQERGAPAKKLNHPPPRPHWEPYYFEIVDRARAVRKAIARLAVKRFNATMRP